MIPRNAPFRNLLNQFLALLYKELLFKKCHYIGTSFHFIFPIIIASIPCMLYNGMTRFNETQKRHNFTSTKFATYQPKEVSEQYTGVNTDKLEFIFAPSNGLTDQFMDDAIRAFFERDRSFQPIIPIKMASEEELRDYILKEQRKDEEKVMIGTVFKDFNGPLPKDLDYKIFYTRNFDTRQKFSLNGPETFNGYTYGFFIRWQAAVGNTFIKKKAYERDQNINYKMFLQAFPYPGYKQNPLDVLNTQDAELFLHLGLMFFALAIVKRLIEDKTDGSKELMDTMGMKKFPYWASTFTTNFVPAFVIMLVITIIYKTSIKKSFFCMNSEFTLLLIVFLLFAINLILFCMTFSIFFNNVAYGAITLMVVYLISHPLLIWTIYTPRPLVDYFSLSLFHKLCICLYPGGGLITAWFIIRLFESGNVGLQWNNLTEYTTVPDINMLMVLGMMVLSCILYIAAIWYFDQVWPWQPGMRKPFHFLFMRNYWFGKQQYVPDQIELVRSEHTSDYFEEEPRDAVKSVVTKDLSKVIQHGKSSKRVLHEVTLKCYQGQITALVGHGEAGKTSLMNMLTGQELPLKGSASVSGLDISTSMHRQFLGICPQRSILYDELSVEQHLKFYAAMKGTSLSQLTYEAEKVLISLKLAIKKTEMVSELSSTEKRKLSLAIAIVGGSEVLLLDEPTYGMDVEARRHVWDALQAIKHERTIIVSTQSFEEADVLGDRIAVMAEGEMHSCGTPAFVKQKLGTGYHLHVLKGANFNLEGLKSLITKHIPTMICENESHKDVSFNLGPADDLGNLLDVLDKGKTELGIISYGVSLSSIGDVSLTVSNMSHTKQILPTGATNETMYPKTDDVGREVHRPVLHAGIDKQFRALFGKHFSLCKRRWKFHLIQLAVPFLLMLLWFYSLKASLMSRDETTKLDISSKYGSTDGFYYQEDRNLYNLGEIYRNVLDSNDVSVKKVQEPTHYALDYGNKDLSKYTKRFVVGGAFDTLKDRGFNLTAWFNYGSLHSMPMSLLLMQTAMLRYVANNGHIHLTLEPVIPLRDKYSALAGPGIAIVWPMCFVPLAFTCLSLSFVLLPTHERTTKAKLLQMMSGVPPALYWISVFLWDYLIYLVICVFLIIPPAAFFPSAFFKHSEAIGALVVLFLLYGWASLPLGYIASILIKRENRGLTVFIGFCLLSGVAALAALIQVLHFMDDLVKIKRLWDSYWFFRLFPLFSLSMGVFVNFTTALYNSACDMFTPDDFLRCGSVSEQSARTLYGCCKDVCDESRARFFYSCHKTRSHLSLKGDKGPSSNGAEALYLGLEGIIFFAVLILLETRTAAKLFSIIAFHCESMWAQITRIVLRKQPQIPRHENLVEDPQVLQEEERVRNLAATQQGSGGGLVVLGLEKKSIDSSVFKRLTFGVNGEESFAILGINGSGKSSLLRMLTGDDVPSVGNAFIQRFSLIADFKNFQCLIGYCPEVDALLEDLTGREMLLLLGQMRGLIGYELQKNVNELIQTLELRNCADELTRFYSVGNKRKLSVALALVGSPLVILLDEPTAGVGPESRRHIWKALTGLRKRTGATILLATQSIEETEALCDRLAIMVNGRFRCLGPVEELKSKQGQGQLLLTVKISKEKQLEVEAVDALKNHIQNSLKSATLTDDYQGILQYHVADPSMTVGHLFRFMSEVKAQFELEDYSIGANSLKQTVLACSRT